jgi:hypothetical protein
VLTSAKYEVTVLPSTVNFEVSKTFNVPFFNAAWTSFNFASVPETAALAPRVVLTTEPTYKVSPKEPV